ncbi:MAG: hypothetical protein Kow0037_16940 [Calditrichia bacterium]
MEGFDPKYLFITALPLETRAVKAIVGFEEVPGTTLPCYLSTDRRIGIVQTGVGAENLPALEKMIGEVDAELLINLGIAGWLPEEDFSPGKIFRVTGVSFSGKGAPALLLPIVKKLPYSTACLLTVEEPVLNSALKRQLFSEFDCPLVDMEAYWVCKLAVEAGKEIVVVKVVSDEAGENTMKQISGNLTLLKNKLQLAAHQIKRLLINR